MGEAGTRWEGRTRWERQTPGGEAVIRTAWRILGKPEINPWDGARRWNFTAGHPWLWAGGSHAPPGAWRWVGRVLGCSGLGSGCPGVVRVSWAICEELPTEPVLRPLGLLGASPGLGLLVKTLVSSYLPPSTEA